MERPYSQILPHTFSSASLYLVLLRKTGNVGKGRPFLDLVICGGIGSLFHPATFFASAFMATMYLIDKRKRCESLFAIVENMLDVTNN